MHRDTHVLERAGALLRSHHLVLWSRERAHPRHRRAKLREREQLARELHDTIAHHVSGIVTQAQAGRAVAASHPERAVETLAVIEVAASRALAEMRSMVRLLREPNEVALAPQPGVADIERLADAANGWPRIEVGVRR